MLAIGRALMANPDLILMDEPSEGLSPMLVLQIEKIMKSLREEGHRSFWWSRISNWPWARPISFSSFPPGGLSIRGSPPIWRRGRISWIRHLGI